MASAVSFVDTSILCNLLPIPGRDENRAEVIAQFHAKAAAREVLIMPVTAVIEAGNFIAQLGNGGIRRSTAQKV